MGWERGAICVSILPSSMRNPVGQDGMSDTRALMSNCGHCPVCQHPITPFPPLISGQAALPDYTSAVQTISPNSGKAQPCGGKFKQRRTKLRIRG